MAASWRDGTPQERHLPFVQDLALRPGDLTAQRIYGVQVGDERLRRAA
jgi:hypothetical protein